MLPDNMDQEMAQRIDVGFILDLLNELVAVVVSCFSPVIAFILLFFKILLFITASFYIAGQKRKKMIEQADL